MADYQARREEIIGRQGDCFRCSYDPEHRQEHCVRGCDKMFLSLQSLKIAHDMGALKGEED